MVPVPVSPTPLLDAVPSSDEVRYRLAVAMTEVDLLRSLLRLAVRREREADRLAHVGRQINRTNREEGGRYATA